jgi:hypothetical protein
MQSGTGVPHSTTLPRIQNAHSTTRSVLECGAPVPLSISWHINLQYVQL